MDLHISNQLSWCQTEEFLFLFKAGSRRIDDPLLEPFLFIMLSSSFKIIFSDFNFDLCRRGDSVESRD